ncbi:MAG: CHAT domain-containing protein [Pirellulaceae bacterium]|nr:CHAT domain-containing protein [Pirellulaceae bacterium]
MRTMLAWWWMVLLQVPLVLAADGADGNAKPARFAPGPEAPRRDATVEEPPAAPGPTGTGRNSAVSERQEQLQEVDRLNAQIAQLCRANRQREAIPLAKKLIELQREVLGEKHRDYGITLHNLALLHQSLAEYAEGVPLLLELREIVRQTDGEKHRDYATVLNNLAMMYKWMEEYGKAEPLLLETREILRQTVGERHSEYARTLHNLAAVYESMGEIAKAEPLLLEAQGIFRETVGENNPTFATSLVNLGSLYASRGDFAKAEPLWVQAREIRRQILGEKHPEYAVALNNLGQLYTKTGEYAKAEPLLLEAREIWATTLGKNHPNYATMSVNLGGLYKSLREYSKAESCLQEAREIWREARGETHDHYVGALGELALLYESMGKHAQAVDHATEASRLRSRIADAVLPALSEAEMLTFVHEHSLLPPVLLSAALHARTAPEQVYDFVWAQRGMVYQVTSRRQHLLQPTQIPPANEVFERYQRTRQDLARMTLAPAPDNPPDKAAHLKRLEALGEEKERLEKQLAAELPDFRAAWEQQRSTPADLAARMPQDAVFVDLLHYHLLEQDPDVPGDAGLRQACSYVAFIIAPGRPVARVELGAVAPIHAALRAWRRAISASQPSDSPQELRRLVWEPIEKQLPAHTKTVFVTPDDQLAALPWAALPGRAQGTVLLEQYAFATVPCGKFLFEAIAPRSASPESQGRLLAVGDVDYMHESARGPNGMREVVGNLSASEVVQTSAAWPALPGTQREIEDLLETAGKRDRIVLRGQEATAARILAELPQARWAHLATHGFFADARFRSAFQTHNEAFEEREQLYIRGQRNTVAGRNPLVLSGLVLAGANLPRIEEGDGMRSDGGILTAEAIASLRLENLELAVLSACDTGLGDVAGGEGVFGLQRAFHQAGARNVVASLWKIDDQATATLMGLFYHFLWKEGKPPVEALRAAQLSLYRRPELLTESVDRAWVDIAKPLDRPRANLAPGDPTSPPKLWAGFVLSGPG